MAKGFSNPIQTYQVTDLKNKTELDQQSVTLNNNSATVSLNYSKEKVEDVINILTKALENIKKNPENNEETNNET